MNTLLLVALLLSPLSLTAASPSFEEAASFADQQPLQMMPFCGPPLVGDWVILSDCQMVGNRWAPANVFVFGGSTLHLTDGSALDIDWSQNRLLIGFGSRVLIGNGARIH